MCNHTVFLTTGCTVGKTTKHQKTDCEFVGNKKIIQNVIEKVFNQRNIGELDELFSIDYVYHHPFGPAHSSETVKAQVINAHRALLGFHIDTDEIISEKNLAATRFTANGKHVASFMGLPATGKHVKITGIIISRIEKGLIVEEWEFADLIGVRQQLDTKNPIPSRGVPLRTDTEDFSWGLPLSITTYPGDSETQKTIVRKMIGNLSDSKAQAKFFDCFSREFFFHYDPMRFKLLNLLLQLIAKMTNAGFADAQNSIPIAISIPVKFVETTR